MEKILTIDDIKTALMVDLMPSVEAKLKEILATEMKSQVTLFDNKILSLVPVNDPRNWVSNELHMTQDGVNQTCDFFKNLLSGNLDKIKIQTSTTTGGGYLIPDQFMMEIFRIAPQYGVFRQNARIIPMKGKVLYMPGAGSTGVTASWTDENTAKTESTITYGQITLTSKKLAGILAFSDELFEDEQGSPDLVTYLRDLYAEAFALKEDQAAFYGDGTSTYGSITGINSASGVVPVPLSDSSYVKALSGTTGIKDLLSMQKGLKAGAQIGAKYWMHPDIWTTIRGAVDDKNSFAVHQPAGPETAMLWGRQVVTAESLPATDAASSPFVWYGNLKNVFLGNRKELTVTILKEATLTTAGNLAEIDAQAIRVVTRLGITVPDGSAFSVARTAA